MAFLCVMGITFLQSQLQSCLAEEFLLESVVKIQEAHYDEEVIRECVNLASDNDYSLNVDIEETDSGYYKGQVELVYKFSVPLTKIKLERRLMEYII